MTPIEISGVFARLVEVAYEYGRLTGQNHIAYASRFGLQGDKIATIYKDDHHEEMTHGEIPLLAFRDMEAAVAAYSKAQAEERSRKEIQDAQWERGQYLRLKAKYEPTS